MRKLGKSLSLRTPEKFIFLKNIIIGRKEFFSTLFFVAVDPGITLGGLKEMSLP